MKNKVNIVLLIIIIVILTLLFAQYLGINWSEKIIFKSCQTEGIDYDSFGSYCLAVVLQRQTLTTRMKIEVADEFSLTKRVNHN